MIKGAMTIGVVMTIGVMTFVVRTIGVTTFGVTTIGVMPFDVITIGLATINVIGDMFIYAMTIGGTTNYWCDDYWRDNQ
jgi:hypothetical protein